MATGHPLITRQSLFAAAEEVTAGTAIAAAALVTGDTMFNAFDVDIQPTDEPNERKAQASMSNMPSVVGAGGATVTLKTEWANSGTITAPLWFSRNLAAAGFAISAGTATVQSGSASAVTLTCASNIDGLLERAAGVMFDLEVLFESGRIPMATWNGQGIYETPSDTAQLARTAATGIPPKFQAATVTFGGTAYVTPRVTFRMNNQLRLRENGGSASGFQAACIYDRSPSFEFEIEKSLLATKDWPAIAVAGTELDLVLAVGSGANGVVTINADKLQLRTRPRRTTREGIEYWSFTAGCNLVAAAGDDELTVVLS